MAKNKQRKKKSSRKDGALFVASLPYATWVMGTALWAVCGFGDPRSGEWELGI